MPKPKPLSKQDILNAMDKTSSNRAAARYLHVSFNHYKKFAKLYKNDKGIDLWEAHKNQAGQGIPKLLRNSGKIKIPEITQQQSTCLRKMLCSWIPYMEPFKVGRILAHSF